MKGPNDSKGTLMRDSRLCRLHAIGDKQEVRTAGEPSVIGGPGMGLRKLEVVEGLEYVLARDTTEPRFY